MKKNKWINRNKSLKIKSKNMDLEMEAYFKPKILEKSRKIAWK